MAHNKALACPLKRNDLLVTTQLYRYESPHHNTASPVEPKGSNIMTPPNEAGEGKLTTFLADLGVEPCFHNAISELCGGRLDYIRDIAVNDLMGTTDANGECIPPAVARGLVRKLTSCKIDGNSSNQPSSEGCSGDEKSSQAANLTKSPLATGQGYCGLALMRGHKEFSSLLRCSVRGSPWQSTEAPARRKVLTAVLDNSGSMRNHWTLVVDAITKVFTDELLADPTVSLKAIAYNNDAEEVTLPSSSSELSALLLGKFFPRGITNFKGAFELAEKLIESEVNRLTKDGSPTSAIDVTTLIFTDGADTSVAPFGHVSAAAATKARKAGDSFRAFLKTLGCSAYTCVAAFGEGHDPEQCQYLSDRYYYINRREVLSDWLMGGLADLLGSSGSCSLSVQLPPRLALLEELPDTIQLDSLGKFEYEIWLQDKAEGSMASNEEEITVLVEANGAVAASGVALMSSSDVACTELQGWLLILDAGEMQLRQIALELRGRRPSATELSLLRERLVGVQSLLQPVMDKASDPNARVSGRALLLSRVEELETRRNRLSYTLGHFEQEDHGDTRKIGAVGIDAVLRDVSQRVPLSRDASRYSRRAELASAMRSAENLSKYGREVTFDPVSDCNAKQAADQGDALFYCVSDVKFSTDGRISAVSDYLGAPVAHDVFAMLSSKRGISSIQHVDITEAKLGIPVYASAGHFERARLFIPDVLGKLSGNYSSGRSERLLLDLLGHSLSEFLGGVKGRSRELSMTLIHKARSIYAVFKSTPSLSGLKSLLDDVLTEANTFIEQAETRKSTESLYSMAAVGLLAQQDWPPSDIARLGDAVIEESTRRAIEHRLAAKSKTVRIQLAWAFLGSSDGSSDWLDCSLDKNEGANWMAGFDVIRVGSEMEALEQSSPGEYCPRDPGILSRVLRSPLPQGVLQAKEWRVLRTLLAQLGTFVGTEKNATAGLWDFLDRIMVSDAEEYSLERIQAAMQPSVEASTLKDVLHDPSAALSMFATECIKGISSEKSREGPCGQVRLELASVTKSLVEEREKLAREAPIVGASYPSLHPWKHKKAWGTEAQPVNQALYDKVRRATHREKWDKPITIREALTVKRYRKRGGVFEFPTRLDTFIPGLHRRTMDLYDAWKSRGRQTEGVESRRGAVAEMLLRLPWDDRDERARGKLKAILGAIWDGLNGVPLGEPLSSALWIDDDVEDESGGESEDECAGSGGDGDGGRDRGGGEGDGWDVL
mmetsp:Transcript_55153/g.165219  ORF Transcript_55153/g.165219 Transcript_55153/m.165219 type:complete len:1231 (+) Transcript_55153:127-3819(+)